MMRDHSTDCLPARLEVTAHPFAVRRERQRLRQELYEVTSYRGARQPVTDRTHQSRSNNGSEFVAAMQTVEGG